MAAQFECLAVEVGPEGPAASHEFAVPLESDLHSWQIIHMPVSCHKERKSNNKL